jgi:hypothetical protein
VHQKVKVPALINPHTCNHHHGHHSRNDHSGSLSFWTTLAQLTRILSIDLWEDRSLGQPFVRTLPAGSGCNSHIFTVASRLVNHTPTIH